MAVGLNRCDADGSGTALAVCTAGATSSDRLRSESPETTLITRWSDRKRNSESTSRAAEGLTAITIVSEWLRTSWLLEATDIPVKRSARPLAIAELRGDKQMERAVTPDEFRPVTIDDVISPVPMNPSRMIFRFHKPCSVFKIGQLFICQHSIRRHRRSDVVRLRKIVTAPTIP